MPRTLLATAILMALAGLAVPARSSVVPDDYPTIQAAIDADEVEVLVRPGAYAEALDIDNLSIVLALHPDAEPGETVQVQSIEFRTSTHGPRDTVTFRNLHVTGNVRLELDDTSWRAIEFVSCRIDGSVIQTAQDISSVYRNRFLDCRFGAGIRISGSSHVEVVGCEFVGPGIRIQADAGLTAIDNRLHGPGSGAGVYQGVYGQRTTISGNQIEGYTVGIDVITDGWEVVVAGNRVTDCGLGIRITSDSSVELIDNEVLRSAGVGIEALYSDDLVVERNRVGHSGDHGFQLAFQSCCTSPGPPRIVNNTSYLNVGSGFLVTGATDDTEGTLIARNIAYRNGTFGLETGLGLETSLECNDWFENAAGTTDGIASGATDLAVDPEFCDPDSDNVGLQADSPLADAPGCGLIGALGVDCGTTAVLVARLTGQSTPEGVEIRWRLADDRGLQELWLERQRSHDDWSRVASEIRRDGEESVALDRGVSPGRLRYRLAWRNVEGNGQSELIEVLHVLPAESIALAPIAPNPARGAVTFEIALPARVRVDLDIVDLLGRRIATIAASELDRGAHRLTWPAIGVREGTYWVRLRGPGGTLSRRFVLIR